MGCGLTIAGYASGAAELRSSVIAALSLHGIYSLSFWELWGGSEGGFSLRILKRIATRPHGRAELLRSFGGLGSQKLGSRLDDLQRARMIRRGERFETSGIGKVIASMLALLHFICNLERTG